MKIGTHVKMSNLSDQRKLLSKAKKLIEEPDNKVLQN